MEHFGVRERGPWADEIPSQVVGQSLGPQWIQYYGNPYYQPAALPVFYYPPLPHVFPSPFTRLNAIPNMHIASIDGSVSSQTSSPWTEPTHVGDPRDDWYHTQGAPTGIPWFPEYTTPEVQFMTRRGYSEQHYHRHRPYPSSSVVDTNEDRYSSLPVMEDESERQGYYSPSPHQTPELWQSAQRFDTSRMEMVRSRPDARDGRTSSSFYSENPYDHEQHVHEDVRRTTNFRDSPIWPTSTYPNSERSSLPVSQDGSSEHSPASVRTDGSSSDYTGSYVRSHDSYRDHDDNSYDEDSDAMSDGIASDEGVYYSSSSDRGDFEDDDGASYEGYSDGEYSSEGYSASGSDHS